MADTHARKLTDTATRNAKAKDKPYKLTDGGGLFLLVQPNGAKLWRYKFRVGGREGLQALGAYPEVSLAGAREAHRTARLVVGDGQNPVHLARSEREAAERARLAAMDGTWNSVVASWRKATDGPLAAATVRQREREIAKYLEPEFKGRNIGSISRADIARLLKPIATRAPEVARNLRAYMNGICEHAIDMGLVAANPVPPPRIIANRNAKNHKAMRADRIGPFMRTVARCTAEPSTKTALLLVLLTVCRKCEVTGARWSEFDLDAGTWDVPAERMKGRKPHWVPLPRQAVALLREWRQHSPGELVFPNRRDPLRPMQGNTLNVMQGRLGFTGETIHGFRAVFSTRYNGAGANADAVERCLAHVPQNKVRAAYNRAEYKAEREALMQDWGDYLGTLLADERPSVDEKDGLELQDAGRGLLVPATA